MDNSHAAMYADDTNITVRSSSLIHVEEALRGSKNRPLEFRKITEFLQTSFLCGRSHS